MILRREIGNNFDKKNIFLATYTYTEDFEGLREEASGGSMAPKEFFQTLSQMGVIIPDNKADVFYYDKEYGYIRFDKIGAIYHKENDLHMITPIWQYYSRNQVCEIQFKKGFWGIGVTTLEPFFKYCEDCIQ